MYSSVDIKKLKRNLGNNTKILSCSQECNVFGDITTLKICYILRYYPEMNVTDIANIVGSSISNVSHMLSKLRDNNVVDFKRVSRQKLYSMKDEKFSNFIDFLFLNYEKEKY